MKNLYIEALDFYFKSLVHIRNFNRLVFNKYCERYATDYVKQCEIAHAIYTYEQLEKEKKEIKNNGKN